MLLLSAYIFNHRESYSAAVQDSMSGVFGEQVRGKLAARKKMAKDPQID